MLYNNLRGATKAKRLRWVATYQTGAFVEQVVVTPDTGSGDANS